MKYSLILRDKAVEEIKEAYKWYDEQLNGLGDRFLNSIEKNTDLILNNPIIFKTTYKSFKEVFIKEFPFVIVYYIDKINLNIVIISVFHCSRSPKKKYKK